jgi:SAM-dependent methyltransferase
MSDVRETVREHYRVAARTALEAGGPACCDDGCCGSAEGDGSPYYGIEDRADLPDAAVLASLGCGNPTAVAELREGETVLDLGSGGGIDVILSAKRVGQTGKVFGLDMTDEMLELARRNTAAAGVANAEYLRGYIEDVPLPDASVDVVISNCVINLSADKPRVFAEMRRVLRPGGRIGVADVVAADELSPADRAERGSYAGCIAGALSFSEFRAGLERAGFAEIEIRPINEGPEGIFAAIVRAERPRD